MKAEGSLLTKALSIYEFFLFSGVAGKNENGTSKTITNRRDIKANAFFNVCSKSEYQNQNQTDFEFESVDCPLVADSSSDGRT